MAGYRKIGDRHLVVFAEDNTEFTADRLRWERDELHGRGPSFVRIGRAVVYRRDDLDTFLIAHRIDTRNI